MQDLSKADQIERILEDLVGFPTISADQNLDLIAYAQDHLSALGITSELSYDQDKTKANLFATIGPKVDGGIVLSGHSDVVPVAGQDWSSNPFQALKQEGKIYGRGTCDMKGFIACALAHAENFARHDLKKPIHIALTYDEEVGCLGVRVLLKALEQSDIKPAISIIGEPTMMRVIEGHKGCHEYTTEFKGLAGHGSAPDKGVSAVEYAAKYVVKLLEIRDALKARAPQDSPFDPPWSTLQIGGIHGGIAHNVIADHCQVEWDFRPINKADYNFTRESIDAYVNDDLRPKMQEVLMSADIITHIVAEADGLEPMSQSEAVQLAMYLTERNDVGVVSFGTEAGFFQRFGVSAVVCGPGSIDQAHKADEYVSLEQLSQCSAMLTKLEHKLCETI